MRHSSKQARKLRRKREHPPDGVEHGNPLDHRLTEAERIALAMTKPLGPRSPPQPPTIRRFSWQKEED